MFPRTITVYSLHQTIEQYISNKDVSVTNEHIKSVSPKPKMMAGNASFRKELLVQQY